MRLIARLIEAVKVFCFIQHLERDIADDKEERLELEAEIVRFENWVAKVRPFLTDPAYLETATYDELRMAVKILGLRITVWPSNGNWEYRFMIDVTVPEIMKKLYSFNMHGFMHAPMAAKLLTELILDGGSTTLDIEQFSIERFRTGQLIPTTRLI